MSSLPIKAINKLVKKYLDIEIPEMIHSIIKPS